MHSFDEAIHQTAEEPNVALGMTGIGEEIAGKELPWE